MMILRYVDGLCGGIVELGLTAFEAEALVSVEAACRVFRGLRPRGKRGSCRPAAMRAARAIVDDLIEFGEEREKR